MHPLNDTLKKRLVGAVVLVSLAVILIPLLLKGTGERTSMPRYGSNVPEKPDYKFKTIEIPLQVPPDQAQGASSEQVQVVESPKEAAAATTAPGTPKAEAPQSAPAPNAATNPKPERKHATATPMTAPTEAGPEAWVVQVGSFGNTKNAFDLRDKLRGKGFNAFVEKVEAEGKTVYRVRIGPQLTREAANAVQAKLAKHTRFNGLVMHH